MESYMWRKEERLKKTKLSTVKAAAVEKSPPQTAAEDTRERPSPPCVPQDGERSPTNSKDIEGPSLKKTKLENNHDF